MSPDQYKKNSGLLQRVNAYEHMKSAYPNLFDERKSRPDDFRGMTIFLGDSAELVAGWRYFNDDGSPMVVWSSGEDLPDLFYNLDKQVSNGAGRVDKYAEGIKGKSPK